MSDQQAATSTGAPAPAAELVRSPLSDGEWHRLHPLTPLLRGGLVFLVVLGIVVTNMRDRLIAIFLPDEGDFGDYDADPIDFIFENNLILAVLGGVVAIIVIVVVAFYVSWRFHTFRITGDAVEVRSGVLFRTHRRAPLDRVQGVNLTRPMIARLLGTAKLEVVGAGTDGNVKLEYLGTSNAETIRGDILRLASGRELGTAAPTAGHASAAQTMTAGITGLIEGVDLDESEPESIVHIPVGRLIASRVLSGSTLFLLLLIIGVVVGAVVGTPWVLFSLVPTFIGFGAYWFRQITLSLRYSIAPTSSGVRITSGLFTTISETIPPGRIHGVAIRQSILWRPFGWWSIRINRLTGRSVMDTSTAAQQMTEVLPIGKREDVERVLRLILPSLPEQEWSGVFEHGILGPQADDPYTNMPRRAAWLRPFSWRRVGLLVTPAAMLARKGYIWRSLVIIPLARLQSARVEQGPIDRMLGIAMVTAHTIAGPVVGYVPHLDRDAALAGWRALTDGAVAAAASDTSHRWSAHLPEHAFGVPDAVAAPAVATPESTSGVPEPDAPAAPSAPEPDAVPLTRREARAANETDAPAPPQDPS
ncbi:PH domain-containing protein [Microbacterium sp. bgisy189]|uniref:PH domain-containing protein n=1 Tax=Microbacterium sp. bgisy189 TaxID=3413798 RepID=UPI003EBD75A7